MTTRIRFLTLIAILLAATAAHAATPLQREAFGDGNAPDNAGWSTGTGGATADTGEMALGDHVMTYTAGNTVTSNGFHLLHPVASGVPNPDFQGDYSAAGITAIWFRARHTGIGDPVSLRATLFDPFIDGSDWAQSTSVVTIENTDTEWQVYSISLLPANQSAGGLNGLPVETILANVAQIGLRHDPLGAGPGTPAPVVAPTTVEFDDITLVTADAALPVASLVGDGEVCSFTDAFGVSQATWQEWLFLGAPRECALRDASVWQDGAVYVYRNIGGDYVLVDKLTRSGNSLIVGDRLGAGVVAQGGYLFVAAANDQDFGALVDPRPDPDPEIPAFFFAGKVHVYKVNAAGDGWDFSQTLISPTPGSYGSFGARTESRHMALNAAGDLAVIGEYNNFEGGVGVLHVYRRSGDTWSLEQTVAAPAGLTNFADSLVALPGDHFVVTGGTIDTPTWSPSAFLYEPAGSGLNPTPRQTLLLESVPDDTCGESVDGGLAAAGATLAIAEPCGTTGAGSRAGRVNLYAFDAGAATALVSEQIIDGEVADGLLGADWFGGQEVIALDQGGQRLAIGNPLFPVGFIDLDTLGTDVLIYERRFTGEWLPSVPLASPSSSTLPEYRMFGNAVGFGMGKVLVHEYNANANVSFQHSAVHVYDPDTDGDGVGGSVDNCTFVANADQRDTNSDGYGNACDPDLDNNGVVNFADVALWAPFFSTVTGGDADFNGDGVANFLDYALYPLYFLQPPGPGAGVP